MYVEGVTAAKKLVGKSIRLVKFSSSLELPSLPEIPNTYSDRALKWAFLVLVLGYSPPARNAKSTQLDFNRLTPAVVILPVLFRHSSAQIHKFTSTFA
jgi:hypothetical protein